MGFVLTAVRQIVACVATAGTIAFATAGARGAETEDAVNPPVRILLIGHDKDGHPPQTHEYLAECKLLAHCLRQTRGVEPVVSNGWPRDAETIEGVKSIVLYVPWGANVLFGGPARAPAGSLLRSGAGLVAVHWSTGAEGPDYGQRWIDTLGAWFHTDFSPLAHVHCDLELAEVDHPIVRGVRPFRLFDEYYLDLRFHPQAKPLLTTTHEGKPQTVAWTFERAGGGRSFGCVAGHYHNSFEDMSFRQTVVNAVLWSSGLDVPAGGAPCAATEAELTIPETSAP